MIGGRVTETITLRPSRKNEEKLKQRKKAQNLKEEKKTLHSMLMPLNFITRTKETNKAERTTVNSVISAASAPSVMEAMKAETIRVKQHQENADTLVKLQDTVHIKLLTLLKSLNNSNNSKP